MSPSIHPQARLLKTALDSGSLTDSSDLQGAAAGLDNLHGTLTAATTQEVACRIDCLCRALRTAQCMVSAAPLQFDFFQDENASHTDGFALLTREAISLHQFLEDQPAVVLGEALEGFDGLDIQDISRNVSKAAADMCKEKWTRALVAGVHGVSTL